MGIRQKLHIVKPKKATTKPQTSPLADRLVDMYRKGKVSARDVGDTSASASSSFQGAPVPTDLAKLAKAQASTTTSSKHQSRNSSRSLMRAHTATTDIVLPPPYIAKTPLWSATQNRSEEQDLAYMPIHEVLEHLAQEDDLDKWTSCSPQQKGFESDLHHWGGRMGVPTRAGHWAIVGLWGDSAPSTKNDSLFLLSFQVLSGIVKQRFWITVFNKTKVCKCGCMGRHTFDMVFQVIAWSIRALIAGVYPKTDHLDHEFPKKSYRGRLAGKRLKLRGAALRKFGDWAWFKQALALRGWQGEGTRGRQCWLCQAGSKDDDCDPYDFSMSARWRSTMMTMGQFWADVYEEGTHLSPIWQIPGFLTQYCIPDFMHVSCLGVVQYLSGNVMWELYKEMGGTTSNSIHICGLLQNMVDASSKALGMEKPFSNLSITMIKPSHPSTNTKPKMRLKAAKGRHFVKVLYHMLQNFFPASSDHDELRENCVKALVKVYEEIDNWTDDGSSSLNIATHGRRHLLLYKQLSDSAEHWTSWNTYPKHHLFAHVVSRCADNPKLEWNYADESEMGLSAAVARMANQGAVETALLRRYRITFKPSF